MRSAREKNQNAPSHFERGGNTKPWSMCRMMPTIICRLPKNAAGSGVSIATYCRDPDMHNVHMLYPISLEIETVEVCITWGQCSGTSVEEDPRSAQHTGVAVCTVFRTICAISQCSMFQVMSTDWLVSVVEPSTQLGHTRSFRLHCVRGMECIQQVGQSEIKSESINFATNLTPCCGCLLVLHLECSHFGAVCVEL